MQSPQTQTGNNPASAMLRELKTAKEEAKVTARTGEGGNPNGQTEELPKGTSAFQASEETPVTGEETTEEAPQETEGIAVSGELAAESIETATEEEPIRIGGQTFKSQREAFDYAERLEREKELTDAHAAGIREALEATRAPVQPQPEPEDNFDEKFYANPKEALKEVQTRARDEAVAIVRAEAQRERLWDQFLNEYPDVRRKDAERILNENWETIGKMTDVPKAMRVIATKVRTEYEEIVALSKPKTVLAAKKQTVSASGAQPKGVTPQKKEDTPLSFAEEVRRLRKST